MGACGCGNGQPPSGWQLIPELKLVTEQPVQTVPPPPAPQPDRASPPPAPRGLPWWAWVVIVVLALSALRSR